MEVAKVTSKGQITIPISIRRKLDINEGDKVLFIYKTDGVMMVNPNTFQGGDITEVAESEVAATEATVKAKKAQKAPPVAAVERDEDVQVAETVDVAETAKVTETAVKEEATQEVSKRPVPPPVEEPEKPAAQIGGLDLGSLLDDIRSIGSNI